MTREEAIILIKLVQAQIEGDYPMDYAAAFDMAIKALEQEPCEDAISRQAVLDLLERNHKTLFYTNKGYGFIKRSIEELPSVSPTRPTGKWEWVRYDYNPKIGNWHCSECRKIVVEPVNYGTTDNFYTKVIPASVYHLACRVAKGTPDVPEGVLYQAMFKQGEIWKAIPSSYSSKDIEYFCY